LKVTLIHKKSFRISRLEGLLCERYRKAEGGSQEQERLWHEQERLVDYWEDAAKGDVNLSRLMNLSPGSSEEAVLASLVLTGLDEHEGPISSKGFELGVARLLEASGAPDAILERFRALLTGLLNPSFLTSKALSDPNHHTISPLALHTCRSRKEISMVRFRS